MELFRKILNGATQQSKLTYYITHSRHLPIAVVDELVSDSTELPLLSVR